jgi:hypothetical protein
VQNFSPDLKYSDDESKKTERVEPHHSTVPDEKFDVTRRDSKIDQLYIHILIGHHFHGPEQS